MIGIDVGFGWTKVVSEEKTFKFPTWLAYYTPDPIAEVDIGIEFYWTPN
jgi:hypothetical protein